MRIIMLFILRILPSAPALDVEFAENRRVASGMADR
jgi:hypothetical protein